MSSVGKVTTENEEKMEVSGAGHTAIKLNNNLIDVKNMLHVPDLSTNLLSVSQAVELINSVVFDEKGCSIFNKDKKCIVNVKLIDGIYNLQGENAMCMLSRSSNDNAMTWHRCLSHINYTDLCKRRNEIVDGMQFTGNADEIKRCEVCMQGKQTRPPFQHIGNRAANILDRIHYDLCGPIEKVSIGNAKKKILHDFC